MILDFTVENFRSIKGAVTLSAVAQTRNRFGAAPASSRRMSDFDVAPAREVSGRDIQLLPVLALIGPNASGKSTLLDALRGLFRVMACEQPRHSWRWVIPFELDRETADAPTRFELRIGLDNTIYSYSVVLDRNQVYSESLRYLPPSPAHWRRLFDYAKDSPQAKPVTQLGDHQPRFPNGPLQNPPFLHAALHSNPELRPLTKWLAESWRGLDVVIGALETEHVLAGFLGAEIKQDEEFLSAALREFDTGIEAVTLEPLASGQYVVHAIHRDSAGGAVKWPLERESIGTRRLFGVVFRAKLALDCGTPMVVDDLEASFHPQVVRYLVRTFQNQVTNPNGAQLIFASHDHTLLRGGLLRRDEVWFVAKQRDGSTEAYPLTDFRPRNDLALDRAYFDGRFGAVPVLPDEAVIFAPELDPEPVA